MSRVAKFLIVGVGLAWTGTAVASPYMPEQPFEVTGSAYGVSLDDSELAAQAARALPVSHNSRVIADQYSETLLQDVGQDSRIALDNWWAQTGAALIVNNILQQ